MFLLSAFSSSFIVLSVRMTCYASLLNPKAQSTTCIHSLSQERDGWMDGCWAGATADPFFFFLLEVDRVDTLRRQHKRVWQVVRHNEITFPSVSYKTTTPFYFIFYYFSPNDSASLHVWNNPPPIRLFALPIQPIILKGSCRKKMKNIFFHDGENTISCRLFNHNKKNMKTDERGRPKTDSETAWNAPLHKSNWLLPAQG